MASLDELLNQGLGDIISSGGVPSADALYNTQARDVLENQYARGLGISSVTRDALAKARVDATLAAQNAQLAALGQAAGITQGNATRAQQASQFGQSLAQRNKELSSQESLANKQMLASGLGAGAGAALQIGGLAFAPEIRSTLRGAFGLGGPRSPGGGQETMLPQSQIPGVSPIDTSGGLNLADLGSIPDLSLSSSLGDLSAPSFSTDFSVPDFSSNFDLGFDNNFDLSGLMAYDPSSYYQWGSYL